MKPSDLSKIAAKLPLSESVRKLNSIEEPAPRIVTPPVAPLGQSHAELCLNKTEKRFLEVLRSRDYQHIGIQEITLRLAWDTRYCPDFHTRHREGEITFWEVKGFMRDDARVKLYAAAAKFPYWRFMLVTWDKQAGWIETVVRP